MSGRCNLFRSSMAGDFQHSDCVGGHSRPPGRSGNRQRIRPRIIRNLHLDEATTWAGVAQFCESSIASLCNRLGSEIIDPAAYTYGNAARTAPYGLFAPHIADIDGSVRREIAITERVKLVIQADVFNLPNAVYFSAPATGVDSANYGYYTSVANVARKFQFSGRLNF